MTDDQELAELIKKAVGPKNDMKLRVREDECCSDDFPIGAHTSFKSDIKNQGLVQWTTNDDKMFIPASRTAQRILPGVYEIQQSNTIGIYFQKIPVITQNILRFPQTNSDKVVQEIQKFWEKEELFKKYNLVYRRGLMLWGVPGGGKTSIVQLIMKDVIDRNGVVIRFTVPFLFTEGMRIFRSIEPDTPVVVIMEDIDSIIETYNESDVLNILDGVNQISKVCFLATTNYPENLGARIINRPSRFDKRFKIGHPNPESRKMYLEHIIGLDKIKELNIDINKWVNDTDGFSLAHLKELFVAVVILGDNYSEALETLVSMKEDNISSSQDEESHMGFSVKRR